MGLCSVWRCTARQGICLGALVLVITGGLLAMLALGTACLADDAREGSPACAGGGIGLGGAVAMVVVGAVFLMGWALVLLHAYWTAAAANRQLAAEAGDARVGRRMGTPAGAAARV